MLPSVPSALEEASASSWDPFPHPCIRLPACLPICLSTLFFPFSIIGTQLYGTFLGFLFSAKTLELFFYYS